MKVLGRDRRKEVEVGGVPGHIKGRHESIPLTEARGRMRRWRRVEVEVAGCRRNDEVDAASR